MSSLSTSALTETETARAQSSSTIAAVHSLLDLWITRLQDQHAHAFHASQPCDADSPPIKAKETSRTLQLVDEPRDTSTGQAAMPTKYSLEQSSLPSVTDSGKEKGSEQVVIDVAQHVQRDSPYPGMSPEDLDRFGNTPFWNRLRKVCFAIFLLLWFSLFAVSIAFILAYPQCAKSPAQKWWPKSTFHQVFVPSFQDSDGDGIGDLRGVESRLEEVAYLGVDALVLSPIFQQKSVPMERFPEDLVSDFNKLDDRLGNMSDLKSLVTAARGKNIRLLLELPINHVGSGHPWFNASRNSDPFYSNFFVWSETQPNNWLSRSGGPAWTRDAQRRAMYYHSGSADQPDLNWRSGRLQALLQETVLEWLGRGFDGVLMTRASDLLEDFEMRNESSGVHNFTRDIPETIDAIKRLRAAIHAKDDNKVLMVEVDSPTSALGRYAAFDGAVVSDVVIPQRSREVLEARDCDAKCLWRSIDELGDTARPSRPANLLGNRRSAKRLAEVLERPSSALLLYGFLPGSLLTYYGDEIGLNGTLAPMRWSNASHGGFTAAASPWISAESGPSFDAAKKQHNSTVRVFRALQGLRKKSPALLFGKPLLVLAKGSVLGIIRKADGADSFLLLVNFGDKRLSPEQLGLEKLADSVPEAMDLVIDTLRASDPPAEGQSVKREAVRVDAGQALLFRWGYVIKEHL